MRVQYRRLPVLTLLLPVFLSCCIGSFAQKNGIKGTVVDTAGKKNLHFAIVALIDLTDTTLYRSVRSDASGNFSMVKIPSGKYSLMISYPKMADFLQELLVTDSSEIDLKQIPMTAQSVLLQEVIVSSGRPVRMRGDTLEYTADSFATRPNANVEELLKRLPGIYVERGGKIYAQGREVQRVLVDGDEFFSDDPGLAAKFLRADAIDKVQVFDQRSETAEFTGVDDGVRTKTINLKLKENKKKGVFGKLSAKGNTDKNYRHEAMGAYFDGPKKISVFGLASKVGNYTRDFAEIGKYVAQDYEMIDDGTAGMAEISYDDYDGGIFSGALPRMLDGGAHYSDKWNEAKQRLFVNYRVKDGQAQDWTRSGSLNVLPDGSSFNNQSYNSSSRSRFSQKGSISFSNTIDSFSSIKVSAEGKTGKGSSVFESQSSSVNEKKLRVNDNISEKITDGNSREFTSNITYRRLFRKEGRSLIMSVQQGERTFKEDNFNTSLTNYYDPATGLFSRKDSLDQLQRMNNVSQYLAGRIVYADRLSKSWVLSSEYGWKRAASSSIFGTFNNKQNRPSDKVDSLSNDYDFVATTHIVSANASMYKNQFSLTFGGKVFVSRFRQADNDLQTTRIRNFINWAPAVNGNLQLRNNIGISFSYNGQTRQPSVEQLQPLRKTSNNLYVQLGNPDLKPYFQHMGSVSLSRFNMKNMSSWNVNVNINYMQNGIFSQSFIDSQNRTVSQFINLNGIPSLSGGFGYSMNNQKRTLRSSVNIYVGNTGFYRLQNGKRTKERSVYSTARFSLSYDWKEVMTTDYSSNLSLGFASSSIPDTRSVTTVTHSHTLNNTFYLPWKMEISSAAVFNFQPANRTFDNSFNYVTWNAGIEKKIFSSESLVLKFEINDILNQNRGYGRFANGANIYEIDRFVVRRFWLLSATWNFSKNL